MKLKNGSWKFEIGSQLEIKAQLCTSLCPHLPLAVRHAATLNPP